MRINFEIPQGAIDYSLGCIAIGFIGGYFKLPFVIIAAFIIIWWVIINQFQSLKSQTYHFNSPKDKISKIELL